MELKGPAREQRPTTRTWAVLLALYALIWLLVGRGLERMGALDLLSANPTPAPPTAPAPAVTDRLPPRLLVQVGVRHMQTLNALRERAIADGVLLDKAFVPAQLGLDGEAHAAKIRLKGDWTDHLEGNTWSFRVHLKADGAVLGMKRLSLQHPKTRNYLHELVFLEAMRREGVIAPRYAFATVELNGSALGLYAVEQHFDAAMLAANSRREGPILKFDEDLWWEDTRETKRGSPGIAPQKLDGAVLRVHSEYLDHVDPFDADKTLTNPALRAAFLLARDSLQALLRDELSAAEVLDVDRFARYYAVSTLLGAEHGLALHNMRFYANPITARLEPVAFDGMAGKPLVGLGLPSALRGALWKRLCADPEFLRLHFDHLQRLSRPEYLESLLAAETLTAPAAWLAEAYPAAPFSPAQYVQNRAHLERLLAAPGRLTRAYLTEHGDAARVEVSNLQEVPVEVVGLRIGDALLPAPAPAILLPRSTGDGFRELRFELPADTPRPLAAAQIVLSSLGGAERAEEVYPWPAAGDAPEPVGLSRSAAPKTLALWAVDEGRKTLRIRRGEWRVTEALVVPTGYLLTSESGATLTFASGGCLVAFGPLRLVGSEEAPITIRAEEGGGGLAVIQAPSPSALTRVHFVGLRPPTLGRWSLSGAVTFYESDVTLTHCAFTAGRAEDTLNVVRSEFALEGCTFRGSDSDALDVDFSRGTITHSTFDATGNDAIDLSGSVVRLEGVEITGAGDKGLSIGEESEVSATNVRISDAVLGVAVKDASHLRLHKGLVRGARVGVALYVKKSEFGPPSAEIEGLVIQGAKRAACAEAPAILTLDGEPVSHSPRAAILALVAPAAESDP